LGDMYTHLTYKNMV